MNKKTAKVNTIKGCFTQILNGDRDESRLFARRVHKLLHSARGERDKYQDIKNIVDEAPNKYAEISEYWRQENFVMAISVIYFLRDREEQPDFIFPWLLQLLQHKNGVIRYAAVRMITDEIGPLTVHIRFPGAKSFRQDRLKPEEANRILFSLFVSLHELLDIMWRPRFEKCKYIDSLPTCPYKSVQMVLAELEESCGQNYLDRFLFPGPLVEPGQGK